VIVAISNENTKIFSTMLVLLVCGAAYTLCCFRSRHYHVDGAARRGTCAQPHLTFAAWDCTARAQSNACPGVEHADKLVAAGFHTVEKLRAANLKQFGLSLKTRKKLSKALDALSRTVDVPTTDARQRVNDPTNVLASVQKAGTLYRSGKVSQAVEIMEQVVQLDPQDSNWHINLGSLLLAEKRTDEAVASFWASIDINPNQPSVRSQLGDLLGKTGRVREARVMHMSVANTQLSGSTNGEVDTLVGRAMALRQLGKVPEAIVAYRKAVAVGLADGEADPIDQAKCVTAANL
jgi:Flp pilus assembly protein TadD